MKLSIIAVALVVVTLSIGALVGQNAAAQIDQRTASIDAAIDAASR